MRLAAGSSCLQADSSSLQEASSCRVLVETAMSSLAKMGVSSDLFVDDDDWRCCPPVILRTGDKMEEKLKSGNTQSECTSSVGLIYNGGLPLALSLVHPAQDWPRTQTTPARTYFSPLRALICSTCEKVHFSCTTDLLGCAWVLRACDERHSSAQCLPPLQPTPGLLAGQTYFNCRSGPPQKQRSELPGIR